MKLTVEPFGRRAWAVIDADEEPTPTNHYGVVGIFETEKEAEGWVQKAERKVLESDTHMNS
jgi:hypothetical protein